jgi:hypothetical protein
VDHWLSPEPAKMAPFITGPDTIPVDHPNGLGIAYVYRTPRGYATVAYGGNRNTLDFHYSFKTIEAAHEAIENWFLRLLGHLESVKNRRKQSFEPHTYKIGDVVTNSWGYDQTNVDWYAVVKTSDHFVWLRPICAELDPDEGAGPMSGYSTVHLDTSNPDPSTWGFRFTERGEITVHKASGSYVSMKHGCGSKWHGEKQYTSWYS